MPIKQNFIPINPFTTFLHIVYYVTNTLIQKGGTLMKQWNGMVRKEWVTMKWPLIVSALVAITVMAVFPFLITGFLATEVHVFEFALVICFLWAGASVFAPVTALFTMLGSEMK